MSKLFFQIHLAKGGKGHFFRNDSSRTVQFSLTNLQVFTMVKLAAGGQPLSAAKNIISKL